MSASLCLPQALAGPGSHRLELPPFDGYDCPADLFVLDSEFHLVQQGNFVEIYRASLRKAPLAGGRADVVCKIAYGSAVPNLKLTHEARIYTKLSSIQGGYVPYCYGYFTQGAMSCLVLEYCGESVDQPFGDLSLDIRGQIINAFFSIHRAGVEHNDAAERNIVWDGKHVYVVDFADASEDHACAAKPPVLNTVAVHAAEFGCPELWDFAYGAQALAPLGGVVCWPSPSNADYLHPCRVPQV